MIIICIIELESAKLFQKGLLQGGQIFKKAARKVLAACNPGKWSVFYLFVSSHRHVCMESYLL